MAKPVTLPRWSSVSQPNEVVPGAGLQDSGWALNTTPISSNFNWLFRIYYTWILWMDGIFAADNSLTVPNLHFTTARVKTTPATAGYSIGSSVYVGALGGIVTTVDTADTFWSLPLIMVSGTTTTVECDVSHQGDGGTITLRRRATGGGGLTAAATVTIPTAGAPTTVTINVVTSHAVVSGESYVLDVKFNAGSGSKSVNFAKETYTQ